MSLTALIVRSQRVTTLCSAAVFILSGGLCHAAETWVVPVTQRDPGALEEFVERAVSEGAQIWREGSRFLIRGELHDLSRETGVEMKSWDALLPTGASRVVSFAPEGSLRGIGTVVTLSHAENAIFLGTSFLLDRVEGVGWAADGTVILDSPYAGGSSARALNFARQFGLRVTMEETAHPFYELKRPRLGVASRDGWVAALLDRYNVPYKGVAGTDFDTIVFETGDPRAKPFAISGGMAICVPPIQRKAFTRVTFDVTNPIAFGMPREEWTLSGGGDLESGTPIARFSESKGIAISEELQGKGRVISFAFRPATYATCKLLLNAVYLGSARRL